MVRNALVDETTSRVLVASETIPSIHEYLPNTIPITSAVIHHLPVLVLCFAVFLVKLCGFLHESVHTDAIQAMFCGGKKKWLKKVQVCLKGMWLIRSALNCGFPWHEATGSIATPLEGMLEVSSHGETKTGFEGAAEIELFLYLFIILSRAWFLAFCTL